MSVQEQRGLVTRKGARRAKPGGQGIQTRALGQLPGVLTQPWSVKHHPPCTQLPRRLPWVQEHGRPLPQAAYLHIFSSQNLPQGCSPSPWPSALLPFSPLPPSSAWCS